jgi:hypothetical protein
MNVTEAPTTAAKLPLTFACGLYDRMSSAFCWGNRRFLRELPPECHPMFRRIEARRACVISG